MEEDQFWSFGRACTGGAMKSQHTEQCPEAVKAQAPRVSEEVPPRNTRTTESRQHGVKSLHTQAEVQANTVWVIDIT